MSSIRPGGATRVVRPQTGRPRRVGWLIAGAFFALLALGYLATYFISGETAPRNASVNGVPIGGLNLVEAAAVLDEQLGQADRAAFTLTGDGDQQVTVDPTQAGLGVDYAASATRAGAGRSWHPADLLRVLTGGGEVASVVSVDRQALTQHLETISADFDHAPADAQLSLDGIAVQHQPMKLGTSLNIEDTVEAVIESYTAAAHRPVDEPREPFSAAAELTLTEPKIGDDQAETVAEWLNSALLPITITTATASAELSAERIAEATTIDVVDDQLTASVDYDALYTNATETIDPLTITKPVAATVQMQDGAPVVVPAVDGESVTKSDFSAGVESVITEPAPRQITLEVGPVPAPFSTADAEQLGITEVVGEFTTYFPPSSYHNTNLGLAAAGINNTLVKPGEIFSLAEATGPRNADTGYVAGGVLIGDRIEMIVGGGVSQSATTTYNAAFFAGMTDIEHHPHTQYFSQYPPGREATVFEGVLDLQFRNDTPHGVLMEAFINPSIPDRGSITVRVWSTKYFDSVTASEPVLSNYVSGRNRVSTSPSCVAQSGAQGFDVSYQRILVLDGKTTTEDYFWRYSAVDQVTCEQPDPPDEPNDEPDEPNDGE